MSQHGLLDVWRKVNEPQYDGVWDMVVLPLAVYGLYRRSKPDSLAKALSGGFLVVFGVAVAASLAGVKPADTN